MNKWNAHRKKLYCLFICAAVILVGCNSSATPVSTISPLDTPLVLPSLVNTTTSAAAEPSEAPTPIPLTSGPFKMVLPIDEITTSTVESLISTSDGSLWLITREKIVRILENEPVVYLADYPGKFVGLDDMGRVWVVNEDTSQISAWDGITWTTFGADRGWTSLDEKYYQNLYSGVSGFLKGEFWLPTSQDVRFFDSFKWVVISRQELGIEPPVYEDLMPRFTIKVLNGGTVWVGECDWGGPGPFGGGGLRWLDDGVWQGESSPAGSGCVNAFTEDSFGRVWVGVDSNLWRFDPASGEWLEFETPDSPVNEMHFGYFELLALDANNEAWPVLNLCGGASCYGSSVLYHLQDGKWIQVGEVAEYDGGYWGPIFDASGVPWFRWQGGIYRITEDSPELMSPLTGRFGSVDKNGRVWFVASYEGREGLWVQVDQK